MSSEDQPNEDKLNLYKCVPDEPTSTQKLVVSIFFGILVAFIASPLFMGAINCGIKKLGGMEIMEGNGYNIPGLILLGFITGFIFRIILW